MKHLFTAWLTCLAFVLVLSVSASAQDGPSPWDTPTQTREVLASFPPQDTTPMPQAEATLTVTDPDGTGYPFINRWKGNLARDPKVFLSNAERQDLTQARVDLSAGLGPIVLQQQNQIRSLLTPCQRTTFESIVARQDLEAIAAMGDMECHAYTTALSQRVRLDCAQEQDVHYIMRHLMSRIAPVQAQYASRFDQAIASAEQRVIAERAARNASISTGPSEIEGK